MAYGGASGRPVRREAVSVPDALERFLRSSGLSARMRHVPVFRAWNEAVGPELSRRAKPVRFERGELQVEVGSAAHYQELASFTGEAYRERANALLRHPEIARVVFRLQR